MMERYKPLFAEAKLSKYMPVNTSLLKLLKQLGEDKQHQVKIDIRNAPVVDLDIEKLVASQDEVEDRKVDKLLQIYDKDLMDPIIVFVYKNKYFVYNGHHRIVASLKKGIKKLPCIVLDADKYLKESMCVNFMKRYKPFFEDQTDVTKISDFRETSLNSKTWYHTTKTEASVRSIVSDGFTPSHNSIFGSGVYFATKPTGKFWIKCKLKFKKIIKCTYIEFPGIYKEITGRSHAGLSGEEKELVRKGYDGVYITDEDWIVVFNLKDIVVTDTSIDSSDDSSLHSNNIYESQNDIKKGDIIKFGKYKNKTATVTGFGTDKNNQPTVVTDKGEMSLYHVRIDRLMKEDLHLSDFTKHAGISPFGKKFMLDRQKIKGAGNVSAKIKSIKVNRKKDYITIVFTSVPTYTKIAKAVSTPSMEITKRVKAYEQQIRFLKFFEWTKTKPGYKESELTWKEIKEVLNVCSVEVFCSCPSYWWQGMAWVDTLFDAAIFKSTIPPKRWTKYHQDYNFSCKHLDILFTSGFNLYIQNITSMVNKYLKQVNAGK